MEGELTALKGGLTGPLAIDVVPCALLEACRGRDLSPLTAASDDD